jgi:hypothetical protein
VICGVRAAAAAGSVGECICQLSSNGRTGILSMVISWEFRGAQFIGWHSGLFLSFCINHTRGKCKEDSGFKCLHIKVKCRFEQQFGECICSTLFQRKNWRIFHGNFLEIRAGAGGPVCFLLTWPPFLPSADTQDFFLSAWVFAGAWPRSCR